MKYFWQSNLLPELSILSHHSLHRCATLTQHPPFPLSRHAARSQTPQRPFLVPVALLNPSHNNLFHAASLSSAAPRFCLNIALFIALNLVASIRHIGRMCLQSSCYVLCACPLASIPGALFTPFTSSCLLFPCLLPSRFYQRNPR